MLGIAYDDMCVFNEIKKKQELREMGNALTKKIVDAVSANEIRKMNKKPRKTATKMSTTPPPAATTTTATTSSAAPSAANVRLLTTVPPTDDEEEFELFPDD